MPIDFEVKLECANAISYAAWQNSVPLISTITVSNLSRDPVNDVELRLKTSSGFLASKTWRIDRILAGDELEIDDCQVELDPTYLEGLNEAEKSTLKLELWSNGATLASQESEVRLLARDEWGGMNQGGELVAAFVMPNDPAVAKVLKASAEVLKNHGYSTALDGYQTKDPKRAYILVSAIWNAVCALDLTYANPPKSFEQVGQKTRTPQTVLQQGLATCLDTSLLFAAAIEAVGLNPVVVMTDNHCFVGAWLVEKTLAQVVEPDCSEIRKALAGHELITFETTLVTQTSSVRFEDAITAAKSLTQESKEHEFSAAIDIARARMAQISPLASHVKRAVSADSDAGQKETDAAFLPLSLPPEFNQLPADTVEEQPKTASGRIDRWQRKLLDLTLRNRLLNFRPTQQSIPILCDDIALLEDLLAGNKDTAGKRLKMISLPDQNPIGERDPELHRLKTNRDLDTEFARQALRRKEISCQLSTEQLDKRLTAIYRAARNDMSEGGSNTLYLAIGFLRWRDQSAAKKTYRAPLLLMPVKLVRQSSHSPFYVRAHEDETRFNATLIQMLKQDFGKDLSVFESNLPLDKNGVDVPLILQQVRQHVREVAGFEVIDECAMGRFSFAKYLLWRDLVDRSDQLKNNRVVKHLLDSPEKSFADGIEASGSIPRPRDIDVGYHPREIFHPLDADSSQLAAVMAVAAGKDLVLIGPPGTGKSQTIANMIAQCLAMGKTVLFVAEKTAALDVVHRRLCQHGLGDCCVELHSNKAQRKEFLQQLQQNWKNNRNVKGNDWVKVSDRLKIVRDDLNQYVAAIHAVQPNGWTAFEAFGVSAHGANLPKPKFDWADTVRHDRAKYEQFESTAKGLAVSFEALGDFDSPPKVVATEWSMKWETELLDATEILQTASQELETAFGHFSSQAGLTRASDASVALLDQWKAFARSLTACAGADVRILFNKQFSQFPQALEDLKTASTALGEAKNSLSADYESSLEQLPLDEMDLQWREASAKFWPLSWFAKRKIQRLLQTYATTGISDPAKDLEAIRQTRDQLAAIDDNALNGQTRYWKAADTDTNKVARQLELAGKLRKSLKQVGQSYDATQQISKAIHPSLSGKSSDTQLIDSASDYEQKLAAFYSAIKAFAKLAGGMPIGKQTEAVCTSSIQATAEITAQKTFLKRWTMWCRAKQQAKTLGMSALTKQLESKVLACADVEDSFRRGYADWLVPKLIDQSPILRAFETTAHENVVKEFMELDSQSRHLASGQVRKAIAHGLPSSESVAPKSELGVLRHQMNLKRPRKSIRDVVTDMPESFRKLAPCLLMSPLSIAQYLPSSQAPFDVVIFDEASQIPTWDAIGAIARGKQTVIVGDPKQLPPTNFFGKTDDDEDEDLADHERDLPSILEEALASGLPEMVLNWHYRSRHEALIAFSNYQYYGNELITFPSAEDVDRGLSLVKVAGAIYDKGKSRTNRKEAEAIVKNAVGRMQDSLSVPKGERLTFGVITFNIQQQTLIQDLFEAARRKYPEIEWFFSDNRIEPTVVKNLENVQGDERDVMYFSVTFGPTETDPKIGKNFGALNRDGGQRRLNVAITRARQQMLVYSSFTADQLNTSGSKSVGLNHLKRFLEFAQSGGAKPLSGHTEDSVGGFDSPFEQSVAEALELRGWEVIPQIGVSGFRIDLGVRHPDKPGAYLAGVECDGATYHRSAAARDRDKTRQLVLEGLGWNILRVWSPDWWHLRGEVIQRLDDQLNALLAEDRDQPADEPNDEVKDESESAEAQEYELEPSGGLVELSPSGDESRVDKPESSGNVLAGNAAPVSALEATVSYQQVKLGDCSSEAKRFFEPDYCQTIGMMAKTILSAQGPVREDILARQIAHAHGYKRTGGRLRAHILEQIKDCPSTDETSGRFLWSWDQAIEPIIPYRPAGGHQQQRTIAEISIAELCGLVNANFDASNQAEDAAIFLARTIGIGRLSQSARVRISEAIDRVRETKEAE